MYCILLNCFLQVSRYSCGPVKKLQKLFLEAKLIGMLASKCDKAWSIIYLSRIFRLELPAAIHTQVLHISARDVTIIKI
jgi:hypothetical protein